MGACLSLHPPVSPAFPDENGSNVASREPRCHLAVPDAGFRDDRFFSSRCSSANSDKSSITSAEPPSKPGVTSLISPGPSTPHHWQQFQQSASSCTAVSSAQPCLPSKAVSPTRLSATDFILAHQLSQGPPLQTPRTPDPRDLSDVCHDTRGSFSALRLGAACGALGASGHSLQPLSIHRATGGRLLSRDLLSTKVASVLKANASSPRSSRRAALSRTVSLKAALQLDSPHLDYLPDVVVDCGISGTSLSGVHVQAADPHVPEHDCASCQLMLPCPPALGPRSSCPSDDVVLPGAVHPTPQDRLIGPRRSLSAPCQALGDVPLERSYGDAPILLALTPHTPPDMARHVWCVAQFRKLRRLHRGYASSVHAAQCCLSGRRVALKQYCLETLGELERLQLFREVSLHAALHHPNIIQLYSAFKEGRYVYMVMEYASGGSLRTFLDGQGGTACQAAGRDREQIARCVLRAMLRALQCLHSCGVLHRDIKPDNTLVVGDLPGTEGLLEARVKLADFGMAIDLRVEAANTCSGTLEYMAPETLVASPKHLPVHMDKAPLLRMLHMTPAPSTSQGSDHSCAAGQAALTPGAAWHYGLAADVWSAGCLAYELVCGRRPFAKGGVPDPAAVTSSLRAALGPHAPLAFEGSAMDCLLGAKVVLPPHVSDAAADWITRAMEWKAEDRPTAAQLAMHPWLCGSSHDGARPVLA